MSPEAFPSILLVDEQDRPIGWIDPADLPASGPIPESLAEAMSPLLDRRTTLHDALSLLLDADVQAGIVTDRTGAVRGIVTVDQIAELMRDTADPRSVALAVAAAEAPAEDAAPDETHAVAAGEAPVADAAT
jgi:osmoprotectant transport system ATP-binding protein